MPATERSRQRTCCGSARPSCRGVIRGLIRLSTCCGSARPSCRGVASTLKLDERWCGPQPWSSLDLYITSIISHGHWVSSCYLRAISASGSCAGAAEPCAPSAKRGPCMPPSSCWLCKMRNRRDKRCRWEVEAVLACAGSNARVPLCVALHKFQQLPCSLQAGRAGDDCHPCPSRLTSLLQSSRGRLCDMSYLGDLMRGFGVPYPPALKGNSITVICRTQCEVSSSPTMLASSGTGRLQGPAKLNRLARDGELSFMLIAHLLVRLSVIDIADSPRSPLGEGGT